MLAIWVGIVDFLPLVGGLLAGVPTVAIAALHSLPAGIVTLVVFLIYQQIENHILNPLVMSRTVKLNPLWVLLAILVGAELGGLVGSTLGGARRALCWRFPRRARSRWWRGISGRTIAPGRRSHQIVATPSTTVPRG